MGGCVVGDGVGRVLRARGEPRPLSVDGYGGSLHEPTEGKLRYLLATLAGAIQQDSLWNPVRRWRIVCVRRVGGLPAVTRVLGVID